MFLSCGEKSGTVLIVWHLNDFGTSAMKQLFQSLICLLSGPKGQSQVLAASIAGIWDPEQRPWERFQNCKSDCMVLIGISLLDCQSVQAPHMIMRMAWWACFPPVKMLTGSCFGLFYWRITAKLSYDKS